MTTFISILLFAASVVGGGFLTLVFLHVLVPLIVRAIGEDKFVDMGGLEPCSMMIYSGLGGGLSYAFAAEKWGTVPALLIFPAISGLCVLYFVLWLKFATFGKNKTEFKIQDGKIIRLRDKVILQPTHVQEDSSYHQTDAFHGYSTFALILCDESGVLAKNGYVNERQKNAALNEALKCCHKVPCRALDLVFVRRKTEAIWWQAQLSQRYASVLCGSLSKLSEESRHWWRQWLRPQFPEDGYAQVTDEDLERHVEALIAAYFAYLPTLEQSEQQLMKSPKNEWTHLRMLLRRDGPAIEIMTSQRFEQEVERVAPNGATLSYGGDENDALAVTIEPH